MKKELENTYLIAINRFRNMVLLGISHRPLKLGVSSEQEWSVDYDFHISCIWRIRKGRTILSGYQDIYTEIDENGEIIEEESEGLEEEIVRRKTLFEKNIFGEIYPDLPLKIQKVDQSKVGDLRIELEKGYCFEAFTTYPLEEEQEEWRLIDVRNKTYDVWPEEKSKRILILDEDNTDLSQILELILQEMIEDDFLVTSAGIKQGKELSERAQRVGREWYDADLKTLQKIKRADKRETYDYVVSLGVGECEHIFQSAEKILMYQEYHSTGCETEEELFHMGEEICRAIVCKFEINEVQREKEKAGLKKYGEMEQRINIFFERKYRRKDVKQ